MPLHSAIRRHGGVPTLFLDGRPHHGMTWFGRPNSAADFARAGLHICTFQLAATEAWWIGPDRYDFQSIDRLIDEFIRIDRRILLMPRIHLGYQDMAWWAQQNPAELAAGRDMRGRPVDYFEVAKNDVGCPFSFASRRFIDDASRALTALVRHLEAREDGSRVCGYHVAGGISAEWFAWWTYVDGAAEDDSPPAAAAFRDWLRKAYRGSQSDLRRAWRDRRVTFETARVPPPAALGAPGREGPVGAALASGSRVPSTRGAARHATAAQQTFRDPRTARPAIDFYTFFSEQATRTIDALCAAMKRACRRRKVVGVFYGYMWPHWNNLSPARQAHAALSSILKSRHVDFIIAPYHYDHRGLDGVHGSQTLPDAVHAAGKLHMAEIDTFTHLTRWPYNSLTTVRHARTPDESRRILRRDAGVLLAKGGAGWWMDLLHQHWHGHPAIVDTFRRARMAAQRLLARDRRSAAQIAIFVDDRASIRLRPESDLIYHLLTAQRQFELPRIGAPWDELLLSDLLRRDLPDYRLCIFPNAFHLAPPLRRAILRYVRQRGRWSLWLYAPGMLGASAELDLRAASRLIGMRLAAAPEPGPARVTAPSAAQAGFPAKAPLEFGAPLTDARMRDTVVYPHPHGWQDQFSPRFYVNDESATSLGHLAGTRRVGFAIKSSPQWTSVYSAAPVVPAPWIRDFAGAAGAHLWTGLGAVVHANQSFISIKSEAGSDVVVNLPRRTRARCLSGHALRQRDRQVMVRFRSPHDTAWILLE